MQNVSAGTKRSLRLLPGDGYDGTGEEGAGNGVRAAKRMHKAEPYATVA
jgi:hypothetical protein